MKVSKLEGKVYNLLNDNGEVNYQIIVDEVFNNTVGHHIDGGKSSGGRCDLRCTISEWIDYIERGILVKEESAEKIDLSKCPGCGGPADNGNDRMVPPNPYFCTKCDKEKICQSCKT